jgi:phage terminase small subunit
VTRPTVSLTLACGSGRHGEGTVSGPPPKSAAKRIRTTTKSIGVVKSAAKAPAMPRGLCEPAQVAWRNYWSDSVSGIMRSSDSTVALRWAKNLDRYHRLIAAADAEPLVAGSTGQDRPNPLYDLAFKVEKSIREDEAQLGIGPLARLKLGVALSESAKSLADLNAEAAGGGEDDPRLTLLRVTEAAE